MGLLIFRMPLSTKYGMRPCIRFNDANDSDAASDATKCWKMVEASLEYAKEANVPRGEVRKTESK